MINIKSSFANCSTCDLLGNPSCIVETNCENNLKDVDVVFVGDYPSETETSTNKIFSDKNGKIFRKYFNKYKLNKKNYLLTNILLCSRPEECDELKIIQYNDACKINCMNFINMCSPKLVVLMGKDAMDAFDFHGNIVTTHEKGDILDWNGFNIKIIVDPFFVTKDKNFEAKYEKAFSEISELLGEKKIIANKTTIGKKIGKGIFRYKIDEKFYTDKYRLVDIQYLKNTNEVLYIFRDDQNNKIYHKENDKFVCYQTPNGVDAKKIMPFDKLNQIELYYKDRFKLDPNITYEGDVKINVKHAMDYYHYNKGEAKKTHSNIMFLDIEVDTGKLKVFPKPSESKFPINMLTTSHNKYKICYVVDNKTEPITEKPVDELKIFKTEKEMMVQFIKDFKAVSPDFACGWNVINFDFQYIYNRLPKIGISQKSFNEFGEFFINPKTFACHMPGCVVLDQDFLYKTFTFTKMENYKLGFIAQHELKETKVELPLSFNEMYWKMLNLTIEYNIKDTLLTERLEEKLAHVNLLNELRIVCNTTFDSVSSLGQIDSLMVSYLKNKGLAAKNRNPYMKKEPYDGAFVFEPTPGVYNWITDFDFASLYPSIMITYNIGVNSFLMKLKDSQLGYEFAYDRDSLPDNIDIIIDPLTKNIETTVKKEELIKKVIDDKLVYTINGCFFAPHKKELSVFGEVVDMLMTTRKDYKGKMFNAVESKNKELEIFFNTRQLVYKVLANTLYGVVAMPFFRFYDNSLAESITLSGQEALKTSIIEADAFMKHLHSGKDYVKPIGINKKEMYAREMPNRSNEFIITGDTDSIFCCFSKVDKNIKTTDINKYCKEIESFLNDDKIIEMVKLHQVDLDFNRLKLKNELVISRGLFLAKKRYAISIAENEGKKVNKINYMGLEIKRSDYPRKSKEFLKEMLDIILKSEKLSIKNVMEFIKRKEYEFVEMIENGDKNIARPVSYGKELEEYKVIPQNVRAMEAFNSIVYPIFVPGVKGYLFQVKGINLDKAPQQIRENYHNFIKAGNTLEVVAIPDEEPKLPDYFIIDNKGMLDFSFTGRYELMIKPFAISQSQVGVLKL